MTMKLIHIWQKKSKSQEILTLNIHQIQDEMLLYFSAIVYTI